MFDDIASTFYCQESILRNVFAWRRYWRGVKKTSLTQRRNDNKTKD
jgi:hypothetical protein